MLIISVASMFNLFKNAWRFCFEVKSYIFFVNEYNYFNRHYFNNYVFFSEKIWIPDILNCAHFSDKFLVTESVTENEWWNKVSRYQLRRTKSETYLVTSEYKYLLAQLALHKSRWNG